MNSRPALNYSFPLKDNENRPLIDYKGEETRTKTLTAVF